MIKRWLITLIFAWAHPALAWTAIATNDPNVNFEIDEQSITRVKDTVKFFEKISYQLPVEVDLVSGKIIHQKKIYRIFDCSRKTQGMLEGTIYGENLSLIESVTYPAGKVIMQAIPKGTLAEAELGLVCRAP